jgi:hypothetical protein
MGLLRYLGHCGNGFTVICLVVEVHKDIIGDCRSITC